jgi:hypothetical protein
MISRNSITRKYVMLIIFLPEFNSIQHNVRQLHHKISFDLHLEALLEINSPLFQSATFDLWICASAECISAYVKPKCMLAAELALSTWGKNVCVYSFGTWRKMY